MEQLGLDMTYWTDVDLHNNPGLLPKHQALFTLGHDEYWSTRRCARAAQSAPHEGGQPGLPGRKRLLPPDPASAPRSSDRTGLQTCYKDAAEDPMSADRPGAHHRRLEPGPR